MLSRNNQSRFAQLPQQEFRRSSLIREMTHTTSFNAGDIVPLYYEDILPGDTVSMDMSFVTRMNTPIHPVYGNANFETFWFFVPNRLLYKDWEHFITGGLDAGEWDTPIKYEPPSVRPRMGDDEETAGYNGFPMKSVADYCGIPVGHAISGNFPDIADGVDALPFRAYAKIWNDWFRSSGLQSEIMIPDTGGMVTPLIGKFDAYGQSMPLDDPQTSVYGGALLKANKYHDYFTSALPEPQRGAAVGIPIDQGIAPVVTGPQIPQLSGASVPPVSIQDAADGNAAGFTLHRGPGGSYNGVINWGPDSDTSIGNPITFNNLYADLTTAYSNVNISINDLRHAIAVQHILEKDARGGNRYIEQILTHFGTHSPDARLQRSEYLGGTSVPINMDQVLQTSATNDVSPQGNTAAFSLTSSVDNSFTKSFVEHGILMCVGVVRHVHVYQQGLAKKWSRKDRFDYFWPDLANISEQAILNKEIYVSGDPVKDNEVFGYQEAWAEYRYSPSYVSSSMRSTYPTSLDVWHYADYYSGTPELSGAWLAEGTAEIDRTLAVSSSLEDQFTCDLFFKPTFSRVIPLYSTPGLDRL